VRVALLLACSMLVSSPVLAQSADDLFDDTVLHEIRLTVSERDWNALKGRPEQNTYYPADLRWRGVTVRNLGVRSRGTSTRNGVKPGLRLDINHYVDQQFVGLRALILDNGYTDPSLLRDSLAMKVFARAGLPAPRESFARLYVNNEYAGVYVVVEPIDRTFITRVFGASEGNVENGGYLYEYTWVREYGFEYLGPSLEAYAELFEPKTRETDAVARLYQPLETLVRAISDTPGEQFETRVGALIDLPALVRLLAIQRVVGEIDGVIGNWGLSNFYLYRFRDGRPAQLLPWDADHSFWALDDPGAPRLPADASPLRGMRCPRGHRPDSAPDLPTAGLRRSTAARTTTPLGVGDPPGVSLLEGF
jgi:spore coat protein CotH